MKAKLGRARESAPIVFDFQLSHYQFFGLNDTVLIYQMNQIEALVPIGCINAVFRCPLSVFRFKDFLPHEVIDFHLGEVGGFDGEEASSRVGIELGLRGQFGNRQTFINTNNKSFSLVRVFHYYEGVGWEPVVLPVEILRRMCCPAVLLTNASGGINPALRPGDFVIVRDHINLTGLSPFIGEHVAEWGERFPDMTEVYNRHLAELLHASANKTGTRAMDGVYAYSFGPCYETPAEIRAYKAQGADVVGMSTVPEAVFAKACGMKAAGLSLVTNLAAGISLRALAHEEVVAAGEAAKGVMRALLDDFLARL